MFGFLLGILAVATFCIAILLGSGLAIGYFLYWLLPEMRLDMSILIGVVAIGLTFIFMLLVLHVSTTPSRLPDEDNEDEDGEDGPDERYRPVYVIRDSLPAFPRNKDKEERPKRRRKS